MGTVLIYLIHFQGDHVDFSAKILYGSDMPRGARLLVPSGIYHVLCRGNNRQDIFKDDADRRKFLSLLLRYKNRYHIEIFHYCLMCNHVHIIVRAEREVALSRAMHGLDLTYAQHFRRRYGGIGHFWQDRFKSFLIEKERYLLECGRYVELNSTRARIYENPKQDLWNSYQHYAFGKSDRVLDEHPIFGEMGSTARERRESYRDFVHQGLKDRRGLQRYFRQKVCGSPLYAKTILETLGLKPTHFRVGRPSKIL